jgi:hypothetical protein
MRLVAECLVDWSGSAHRQLVGWRGRKLRRQQQREQRSGLESGREHERLEWRCDFELVRGR